MPHTRPFGSIPHGLFQESLDENDAVEFEVGTPRRCSALSRTRPRFCPLKEDEVAADVSAVGLNLSEV